MYTRITHTANGSQALKYAAGNGEGHNENDVRNQFVSAVNMFPGSTDDYIQQMEPHWAKKNKKCKNEVRRVIQSFSPKELDPENPADIIKAHQIGVDFVEQYYPGHQAVIYTQIDGKGKKIHNHIMVNNVNMNTHKGCTDEQATFSYIKKGTNAIASKYFELDAGTPLAEKITQTERVKREKGLYVWKDDLKARILDAKEVAIDEASFFSELASHGVSTRLGTSKNRGTYITYNLTDRSNFGDEKQPKNGTKCRSYKMPDEYFYDNIINSFGKNQPSIKKTNPPIKKDFTNPIVQPVVVAPVVVAPVVTEPKIFDFPRPYDWFKASGMARNNDDPKDFDNMHAKYDEAKKIAKDLFDNPNKTPQIASEEVTDTQKSSNDDASEIQQRQERQADSKVKIDKQIAADLQNQQIMAEPITSKYTTTLRDFEAELNELDDKQLGD